MCLPAKTTHQKGERILSEITNNSATTKLSVDTFEGRVHVECEPPSAVTALGQLSFFMEFLKLGNLCFS